MDSSEFPKFHFPEPESFPIENLQPKISTTDTGQIVLDFSAYPKVAQENIYTYSCQSCLLGPNELIPKLSNLCCNAMPFHGATVITSENDGNRQKIGSERIEETKRLASCISSY